MRSTVALLLLLAARATASPRVSLPPRPSLEAMTRAAAADRAPLGARCFAYSPASHAFACLGHDPIYNTTNIGADDQATNIRIDVIGPAQQISWTIAAIGGRPTVAPPGVEGALAALGLRTLATPAIQVPANRWVAVGTVKLFLRVDPHEGDASFENLGDLTMRCPRVDVVIDLRAAQIELGDVAVAYRSPDGTWLALAIAGLDGGEDTYTYTLDTAVLDVAATCATQRAVMWTTPSRPGSE